MRPITRRQALGSAGAAGAVLLGARAGLPEALARLGAAPAEAASACSTLTPELTEGPYWVDLALHRSNVTANTSTAATNPGAVQAGVPLTLTIDVLDAAKNCAPLNHAVVDIWHANAYGLYSDEGNQLAGGGTPTGSTAGENFLRGYQITGFDTASGGHVVEGQVQFQTIWPGWYSGRAIHIHVRVRTYANDTLVDNYTTQIFFPDAQNNTVLNGAAPYNTRNPRTDPTTDLHDTVLPVADYQTNVVTASGSIANGYAATFIVALRAKGGSTGGAVVPHVSAVLNVAVVNQSSQGNRYCLASFTTNATVGVSAQIVRGRHVLGSAKGRLHAGHHELRIGIHNSAASGPATLVAKVSDLHGQTKTLKQTIHIPKRA